MGKELEPFEPVGDLTPMYGPAVNPSYSSEIPEWMEAEPPYGPTDSLKDRIDRGWSKFARWPRYVFIAGLWVTFSIWRFVAVFGTIGLVLAALLSR